MKKEHWGSKLGFILAVAGSAIGLGNIWRFPYIVGYHGGAAFICVYIMCLAFVGFPAFLAEISMGRTSQADPATAFAVLGRGRGWRYLGILTIVTGFLVSAFYSAVAGWVVGYWVEAMRGTFSNFSSLLHAQSFHQELMDNPYWGLFFHALFILMSSGVLYFGVKGGIEKSNKVFVPLLFFILIFLVFQGLFLPNRAQALSFLFSPRFDLLTPAACLMALGHSFFTLSVGQGTLVTYGSYLERHEPIMRTSYPIVLMDTLVSFLASVAVFTIVFSVGIAPDAGPSLLFQTLPFVFSQMVGGYGIGVLFFGLVFLAAITSQISAMEPFIAYLCQEWGCSRQRAVVVAGVAIFCVGVPCALSTSLLKNYAIFGSATFLDFLIDVCSELLIPLGGLAAVVLVGWRWGSKQAVAELTEKNQRALGIYLHLCFRYISPLLILLVFLSAIW